MPFYFDFSFLERFVTLHPLRIAWEIFQRGGWAIFLIVVVWGGLKFWLFKRQLWYDRKRKFVLLAIDIPKGNEQTPKAIENIFSHLAGAHGSINLYEKWWLGKTQETFSFELVSIEGYVRFLIRTNVVFRDLVEASVYSQYPDAQITEAEDYIDSVPRTFPNPTHLLWGSEFILQKSDPYPVRTYPQFEDRLSQEFKDPMSVILEDLSRLKPGEQAWFQIILTPITQKDWPEEGQRLINKIIGRKVEAKKTFLEHLIESPLKLLAFIVDMLTPGPPPEKRFEPDIMKSIVMMLPPHERTILEAIGIKIGKIGFKTKMRFIYVARREIYFPARIVNGFVGGIKQFNTVDLNSFKPATKYWTVVKYYLINWRTNIRRKRIMRAYRVRSNWRGAGGGFILNTEELASVWHFPVMQVKAPLVKKTESKRAEPPFTLPVAE